MLHLHEILYNLKKYENLYTLTFLVLILKHIEEKQETGSRLSKDDFLKIEVINFVLFL